MSSLSLKELAEILSATSSHTGGKELFTLHRTGTTMVQRQLGKPWSKQIDFTVAENSFGAVVEYEEYEDEDKDEAAMTEDPEVDVHYTDTYEREYNLILLDEEAKPHLLERDGRGDWEPGDDIDFEVSPHPETHFVSFWDRYTGASIILQNSDGAIVEVKKYELEFPYRRTIVPSAKPGTPLYLQQAGMDVLLFFIDVDDRVKVVEFKKYGTESGEAVTIESIPVIPNIHRFALCIDGESVRGAILLKNGDFLLVNDQTSLVGNVSSAGVLAMTKGEQAGAVGTPAFAGANRPKSGALAVTWVKFRRGLLSIGRKA